MFNVTGYIDSYKKFREELTLKDFGIFAMLMGAAVLAIKFFLPALKRYGNGDALKAAKRIRADIKALNKLAKPAEKAVVAMALKGIEAVVSAFSSREANDDEEDD